MIQPDGGRFAGEATFSFTHILLRDVAYQGILKAARADLHGRFADWLEQRRASAPASTRRSSATTWSAPTPISASWAPWTTAAASWPPAPPRGSARPGGARWPAGTSRRR